MIPHTYPSQLDENNTTQMVVYYLSNVSGLERWKDYIPVKETPLASPELNSFNINGAIYTSALSSIEGKQAWVDYIPVYEDSLATDAWTINAVGYLTTKSEVVAKALAVIASYGTDAHVYLPGIGVINGLTAGNYLDSAGTTAATVDNPVGLVLDGAGSEGTDISGGSLSSFEDAHIGVTHTAISFTNGAAGAAGITLAGLTVGKTYKVTISGTTTGNIADLTINTANAATSPTARTQLMTGFGTVHFVADYQYLYFRLAVVGTSATYTSISVKEVTGIHATQGTTANKPILRRGAVNQIRYSQDFSNALWVENAAGSKVSTTELDPLGNPTALKVSNAASVGAGVTQQLLVNWDGTYSASIWLKDDGVNHGVKFLLLDSAGYTIAGGDVTTSDTWTKFTLSGTSSVGTSVKLKLGRATGVGFYYAAFAHVNKGTLSDYIPTTTAPASSSTGNYHWVHDSTDLLTATYPAGYESATVINALAAGQQTLTAQNIVGSYNIGPSIDTYGRFIFRTGLSASELTTMQTFANRLAGV